MSAGCLFCGRIERRDYDAGDLHTVTFEPLNPVTPGHRLFVPRTHEADGLRNPLALATAMQYAALWAAGHKIRACNFISSAGADATQTVFHLHVHLVPRRKGDGLALPWTRQAKEAAP